MGVLAGVYAARGHHARGAVRRLLADAAHRGPDGEYVQELQRVAIAVRVFETGDMCAGAQPFEAPDGSVVVVDGRIDNHDDLTRSLAIAPGAAAAEQLVLASYRTRGVRGLADLIGDFALALWDAAAQRLILATDGMGRRSLYYVRDGDVIYWCSLARPLRDRVLGGGPIDLEYAADFLGNRTPAGGPFQRVESVSAGTALVVSPDGVRVERFWSFDPSHELRYAKDEDYEAHFRDLFDRAVSCRVPARQPVFCELSGGVDSSSIACAADRRVRSAAGRLSLVSYVFPRSVTADEALFRRAVEDHVHLTSGTVSDVDFPFLAGLEHETDCDGPTNALWVVGRYDEVARRMAADGARILLSGVGGDQMFWSEYHPGLPIADLLAGWKLRAALQRTVSIARERHRSVLDVAWHGVGPLLPRAWQARMATHIRLGEWFHPSFARRYALADRLLPMQDDVGFREPVKRLQYGIVRRTMRQFALEPCLTGGHIDMRYPYLDRRVAEFAMAIPLDQKARGLESRSVVRRGLRGLVPDIVLGRASKAGPEEAWFRAVIDHWPWLSRILDAPRIADLGIVDAGRFASAMTAARHGHVTQQAQLMWTVSLELWLRHVDGTLASLAGRRLARSTAPVPRSLLSA